MKKMRKKVYVKIDFIEQTVVCSGIGFGEFIKHSPKSIENLMSINMGHKTILLDSTMERGFELFEGCEMIRTLTKENLYLLGTLCFVDYNKHHNLHKLTEEQVAELLYMGHTFKPLHSPFFDSIENHFCYPSHDDGWYTKIFCRELSDMVMIFLGKILNKPFFVPDEVKERILSLMENGLMVELPGSKPSNNGEKYEIYSVGVYENMDDLLNKWEVIKLNSTSIHQVTLCSNGIVNLNECLKPD